MMIHTTSESDITSLATSSPRSSPAAKPQPHHHHAQLPPAYYVQSPSRDSHDELDKSSTSASATVTQATSTPVGYRSPTSASSGTAPPASLLSLFSRQSRSSSSAASRVSGGGRRKGGAGGRRERARRRLLGHVAEGEEEVEEEEGEEDREFYVKWWRDDHGREELSTSCKVVMSVVGLGLMFFLSCFIVWGASRPFTAQVSLKKMTVDNFYFGEGSDLTGVPTKILTINCTLKMRVYNPATFFGIHVSFSAINLRYYDLNLASGQLEKYYQPKKSWRTMAVNIQGSNVPLYGAGAAFVISSRKTDGVPLILDFEIRSRGDVVGKLVKTKHHQRVTCSVTINTHTTQIVKFAGDSCVK